MAALNEGDRPDERWIAVGIAGPGTSRLSPEAAYVIIRQAAASSCRKY